jgi:hypothetical protein
VSAKEAVRVHWGMRGVSIDGKVFEIGTAFDEYFYETMEPWDGFV